GRLNYYNVSVYLFGLVVAVLGHEAEFKLSEFFRSGERERSVSFQLNLLVQLAVNDHANNGACRSINHGAGTRVTWLNFRSIFYRDIRRIDMELQRVAINVALVEDIIERGIHGDIVISVFL